MARVRNAILGRFSSRRNELQRATRGSFQAFAITDESCRIFAAGGTGEGAPSLRLIFFFTSWRSSTVTGNYGCHESRSPRLQPAVPEESILLGGYLLMNATASGIWRKNAALAWREIEDRKS